MIYLNDLSIVIPYRQDSDDRRINLETIICYFNKYFVGHEIILIEDSPVSTVSHLSSENVRYFFEKNDGLIHRTKRLNQGCLLSNREYVSFYDTDVVFKLQSIEQTLALLKNHAFVFPYNGIFMDVQGQAKQDFIKTVNIDSLHQFQSVQLLRQYGDYFSIHTHSVGGSTFFRRKEFMECGGYNEEFVFWGFEDDEIVHRFSVFGHPPVRVNGILYHLNHPRNTEHPVVGNNRAVLSKIRSMSKEQLRSYVKPIV